MKISLCLSGGAIKGAAHIGVIRALEEKNIEVEYISGTSSGSIIASLYAAGYNSFEMENIFKKFCPKILDIDKLLPFKALISIFSNKIFVKGICKGKKLEKLLYKYLAKKDIYDISQVNIPLVIQAVDIKAGEVVYFTNSKIRNENLNNNKLYDDIPSYYNYGSLSSIVRASCSLPAIYIPKNINGKNLIDGGVRENTPISILKDLGAKNVICVSFDTNKEKTAKNMNIFSIMMQSFDIMCHQINKQELELADLVLRPDVKGVSMFDCNKIDYCIKKGYLETIKNMDKILKYLN